MSENSGQDSGMRHFHTISRAEDRRIKKAVKKPFMLHNHRPVEDCNDDCEVIE